MRASWRSLFMTLGLFAAIVYGAYAAFGPDAGTIALGGVIFIGVLLIPGVAILQGIRRQRMNEKLLAGYYRETGKNVDEANRRFVRPDESPPKPGNTTRGEA